jgi:hypothetical protein
MKKLKIFDAVEEVMNMDDLQLIQARKHFKWAYLRSALEELREFISLSNKSMDFIGGYQPKISLFNEELNPPSGGSNVQSPGYAGDLPGEGGGDGGYYEG